jgi:hypothetical protein
MGRRKLTAARSQLHGVVGLGVEVSGSAFGSEGDDAARERWSWNLPSDDLGFLRTP